MDASRKKVWKEITKNVKAFGRTWTVSYPTIMDPRMVQIGVLSFVNILGQTVFHFAITPLQIITLLISCVVLDTLLTYATKKLLVFPTSGFITGLSMALLLQVNGIDEQYGLYILAAILGIGSKYFLTFRGKHIFNPSNFAIVILLIGFDDSISVNPDEWRASFLLLLPIILLGSRLIYKAKVVGVALSFIITEAILYAITFSTPVPMTLMRIWSPSLYIFTFYMITDPRTAPRNIYAQILFGSTIAVLHWVFDSFNMFTLSLFLALFVVCAAIPVIRILGKDPAFGKVA